MSIEINDWHFNFPFDVEFEFFIDAMFVRVFIKLVNLSINNELSYVWPIVML